jgi:hypothetical protein
MPLVLVLPSISATADVVPAAHGRPRDPSAPVRITGASTFFAITYGLEQSHCPSSEFFDPKNPSRADAFPW